MRRLATLVLPAVLCCCQRGPSHAEALAAIRSASPAEDSAVATVRGWADGPPWFSCAEVLAKLRSSADHSIVAEPLGNWRWLVRADWVTLRDTAAGPVVEPGWCAVTLHDEARRTADGWMPVHGSTVPNGGERRGWDVTAGRRHVVVGGLAPIGADSASVSYLFTILPNANGVALGADRDTVRRVALLEKLDGRWRLVRLEEGR